MKQIIMRFRKQFEAMAMAVAFAEAGEWSTAERIMDSRQQSRQIGLNKKTGKKERKKTRMRL